MSRSAISTIKVKKIGETYDKDLGKGIVVVGVPSYTGKVVLYEDGKRNNIKCYYLCSLDTKMWIDSLYEYEVIIEE